jgi:hypothetical protein
VLESFVTKARDKAAALKFIKKAMKLSEFRQHPSRPVGSYSKVERDSHRGN